MSTGALSVISEECMLVHRKSGLERVNLGGIAEAKAFVPVCRDKSLFFYFFINGGYL